VIVVSNSSPLIALSRIGRLEILASFYKRILVPAEVHHEVTVDGRGLPGAEEVRKAV
jgi:predicted nucleic acid-binding protein